MRLPYTSKAPCTELGAPTRLSYKQRDVCFPNLPRSTAGGASSLWPSCLRGESHSGTLGSCWAFSSQPRGLPSMTRLQPGLLFQKVNEEAFGHLQKQRRIIIREPFLPARKGRKPRMATCQLLEGSLPDKDGLSPKEATVLVGR